MAFKSVKGSESRVRDYKTYNETLDSIEWRKRGTYCINCGITFKPNQKRITHSDKFAECIKCNTN